MVNSSSPSSVRSDFHWRFTPPSSRMTAGPAGGGGAGPRTPAAHRQRRPVIGRGRRPHPEVVFGPGGETARDALGVVHLVVRAGAAAIRAGPVGIIRPLLDLIGGGAKYTVPLQCQLISVAVGH